MKLYHFADPTGATETVLASNRPEAIRILARDFGCEPEDLQRVGIRLLLNQPNTNQNQRSHQ